MSSENQELKMQLYFVNVGYGESIVIKNAEKAIVIDGGPDDKETYEEKGTIRLHEFLKKIEITTIEAMILTHLHYDHVGGLYKAASCFPVKNFYTGLITEVAPQAVSYINENLKENISTFMRGISIYEKLLKTLTQNKVTCCEISKEDRLSFFDGQVQIQTLGISKDALLKRKNMLEKAFLDYQNPDSQKILLKFDKSENLFSLAQFVTVKNRSFMLTADQSGIARFADELQRSNVVKLTHHGQIDGMPPCLIDICKPSFFVICADINRTYNSARPEIVAAAQDFLNKESIAGKVFITGMLNKSFPFNKEVCAVGFDCTKDLTYFPVIKN